MAVLQEDFEAYALWGRCEEVQSLITQTIKNVNGQEFLSLHRLSEAVIEIASLRHISAWRFPDAGAPQALDTQLESVKSPLLNLIQNPEVSIADSIEAHLLQISSHLLNCPSPITSPNHLVEAAAVTEKYRIGISEAIDLARGFTVEAEEELQKVVTAKDAAIATLTEQIEDLKNTIGVEKAAVSAQATRLDTALTTNSTALTTKMTEWQDSFESDRKEARGMAKRHLAVSQNEAKQHIAQLKELEKQARKLTEATAQHSISTEYGAHAQKLSASANKWSIAAVAVAVTGLIALFSMMSGIENITPAEAIWKTSLSALTVAIATYMGRESAGHRKDARDAKRMQLDLNALEPFLANMKEDTAQNLREQFAKQIFSRPMANSKEHAGFGVLPGGSAGGTGNKSKEEVAEQS
ncbi:hypothetical protein [Arthrobacter antibioticus]|uniref:hypothetical protein n=1 Tax=Arthrobacter sp. H35-MC1 TaxID=3046203 RepID=UPI0024B987EF|nr:hypothetical protein [Arthrobacter sp. H35-MC1]MDJ0318567.1 hypothetical protein [Arthrobacter sp. H35-MC1]